MAGESYNIMRGTFCVKGIYSFKYQEIKALINLKQLAFELP